ncbi:Pleckstrin y domain-containing A member 5 [Mortierella claussenii]|nr:Pleckstrin y domain-containing A member 5 [Mortierella claussenii]
MLEEWLQKRSSSLQLVWKRRWCVLRDDCLYYYRSNTDTKPLGALHLADFSILSSGPEVSRKSKLAFKLSSSESIPCENQHHLFHTETPQALDLWLDAIQGHINHALARLDALRPLDINLRKDRQRHVGSSRLPAPASGAETSGTEQSIIDKVLDRLQLEDPTLSDMNDPSTLIMPAQEHPSYAAYQHPTQKSFRELQLSLGDILDGWSPSTASSTAHNSNNNCDQHTNGGNSFSINTTMNMDHQHHLQQQPCKSSLDSQSSSTHRSPIDICGMGHGKFSHSTDSYNQSATSSYTDPQSAYSSYSDLGLSMSGNNHPSLGSSKHGYNISTSHRGSTQTLDHQGRPSLYKQQGRGGQGHHSASSSLTSTQFPQHLQSPVLYTHRTSAGAMFSIDTNHISPTSSNPGSPLASPKMTIFHGLSGRTSTTTAAGSTGSSSYAIPPSPRTLFYRVDTNPSQMTRRESNASLTSISTINSAADGEASDDISPSITEQGLIMATSEDQDNQKRSRCGSGSGSGSSPSDCVSKKPVFGKKYCTDSDVISLPTVLYKDEKAGATSASSKKTKKLWPLYSDNAGSGSSAPTSGAKSHASTNSGRKTVSRSLDTSNPMFKSLILVSSPTKKFSSGSSSSRSDSSTITEGKRSSKPIISLPKTLSDPQSEGTISGNHLPTSVSSSKIQGFDLTAPPVSSRTRSPSVSALERAAHPQQDSMTLHRPIVGDIISSRSSLGPPVDSFASSLLYRPSQKLRTLHQGQKYQHQQSTNQVVSSPKISTAPIAIITNEWSMHVKSQQKKQQLSLRCVDPALLQYHNRQEVQYVASSSTSLDLGYRQSIDTGSVSRHIVAPDELTMAMRGDQEQHQQQQEGVMPDNRSISMMEPAFLSTDTNRSDEVATLAMPESLSASPSYATVIGSSATQLATDNTAGIPAAGGLNQLNVDGNNGPHDKESTSVRPLPPYEQPHLSPSPPRRTLDLATAQMTSRAVPLEASMKRKASSSRDITAMGGHSIAYAGEAHEVLTTTATTSYRSRSLLVAMMAAASDDLLVPGSECTPRPGTLERPLSPALPGPPILPRRSPFRSSAVGSMSGVTSPPVFSL